MGRLDWHLVFLIPDKLLLKCSKVSRGGDRPRDTHTNTHIHIASSRAARIILLQFGFHFLCHLLLGN